MLTYVKFNVNPKGRKTGDCSTRALALCLGITWEEALKLQYEESLKTKYDMSSRKVMGNILAQFGYAKQKQPRKLDGTKYKVKEMDRVCFIEELNNNIIVNVANHYVCIKNFNYYDIWDSGNKTVGNYFIKKEG